MRTIILFTLVFTHCATAFGQGFYDTNPVLLNKKNISKKKVSSVVATCDYTGSSFHPLSNFVFEYKFDSAGNINKRKYWFTEPQDDQWMTVQLVSDTLYFVPEMHCFMGQCLMQSPLVKFNQEKERTKKYINYIFCKFNLLPVTKNERCMTAGTGESDYFNDTILLNKQVHIPRWLIPNGDSIAFINDTLMAFVKTGKSVFLAKCYLTTNNTMQMDWILDKDVNKVWRTYYINSLGLVYKETQNIFTTLYLYNPDNLHTKTETYQYNSKTSQTTFTYKYGGR